MPEQPTSIRREHQRLRFFSQLLTLTNQKNTSFQNVSQVGYQSWILAGAGTTGVCWQYNVLVNKSCVQVLLNHPNRTVNKERFRLLYRNKKAIERRFGEKLEWDYKQSRKQHYIRSWCEIGGLYNVADWTQIQNELVNKMLKLQNAFSRFILQL